MAVVERDVVLMSKNENGDITIDKPITRLGNIEANADVKEALNKNDFVPVIDSEDNSSMKMVSASEFIGGNAVEEINSGRISILGNKTFYPFIICRLVIGNSGVANKGFAFPTSVFYRYISGSNSYYTVELNFDGMINTYLNDKQRYDLSKLIIIVDIPLTGLPLSEQDFLKTIYSSSSCYFYISSFGSYNTKTVSLSGANIEYVNTDNSSFTCCNFIRATFPAVNTGMSNNTDGNFLCQFKLNFRASGNNS